MKKPLDLTKPVQTRGGDSARIIFNIPEKHQRTGWFNFYKDGTARFHPTKPDADRCRGTFCIASVPVTVNFEAGDGL